MDAELEGLVRSWQEAAKDMDLRYRNQTSDITMKVDVLRRCAGELEKVLRERGQKAEVGDRKSGDGTEGTDATDGKMK